MKVFHLRDMVKGWFIGDFMPVIWQTRNLEVAVKIYKAGDYEPAHYHKVATEITVITNGQVRMNEINYSTGDIIVMEPNESTDFLAVTDVTTTVVKYHGANNDKYVS